MKRRVSSLHAAAEQDCSGQYVTTNFAAEASVGWQSAIADSSGPSPGSATGCAWQALPNPNQLLSRDEIQQEYNIPRRWLELAALSGGGPPFVRISRRMVRYQRGVLERWIADRTRMSTADLGQEPKN